MPPTPSPLTQVRGGDTLRRTPTNPTMSRSRKDGRHGGAHRTRRRSRSLASDKRAGLKLDYRDCGCCELPRIDAGDRARIAADAQMAEFCPRWYFVYFPGDD